MSVYGDGDIEPKEVFLALLLPTPGIAMPWLND